MGYYDFKKDLKESEKDFQKVKEFLLTKKAIEIKENYDGKYDLMFEILDKVYTIEIKHDYLYKKTGNVAIEFKSRGKNSGIETTKASIWCYILDEDLYFAKTKKIKTFLLTNNFKKIKGGDENTSEMYLIPLKNFQKLFIKKT